MVRTRKHMRSFTKTTAIVAQRTGSLVSQRRYAGQLFARKKLECRATAGGNVRDALGDPACVTAASDHRSCPHWLVGHPEPVKGMSFVATSFSKISSAGLGSTSWTARVLTALDWASESGWLALLSAVRARSLFEADQTSARLRPVHGGDEAAV
jgi:hypothetical protein